ncbi:MAG TPA: hypothetical protein VK453_25435 [Micromonosporaceae bacterium]|nr:hypothetical protein [Micromonosporaceae bacterium]
MGYTGPWRVAKSLIVLHNQLRPLAPKAPATSFGTIADLAHNSTSEHYPHIYPTLGKTAVVCAKDFPLADRLDPRAVLEQIRLSRDPRVKYAISCGQMFSSYPVTGYPAWTWRPYGGKDKHFDHGHLSVVGDARADDIRPWRIAPPIVSKPAMQAIGDDMPEDLVVSLRALLQHYDGKSGIGGDSWIALVLEKNVQAKVADLVGRPAPSLTLTDAQVAAIAERADAASSERLAAVERKLDRLLSALGSADNEPPA